mmetsp:Transcript_44396/g.77470  ORF Transcript_44396/g.77470 Transcript_44396/m.77470 type:complete len:417 (+) Transcript_44396:299-1549(+)
MQLHVSGAVLSERIDHGIDSAGEVAVVRVNLEQTHIRPFETIHAEQRADDSGVDAAANPHKQVVTVLQQEQTVCGESLVGQVEDGGQADGIGPGGRHFVVGVSVVAGQARVGGHVVQRKHARVNEHLALLDVHVEQQLLEVSSLVDASVGAAAHHRGLLQGHGVQGQQQQTVGNLHRRSLLGHAVLARRAAGSSTDHAAGAHDVHGGLVHTLASILHTGLLGDLHGLLGEQIHGAVNVQTFRHLRRGRTNRNDHGVDADATLARRRGVQQRSLDGDGLGGEHGLVVCHVQREGTVGSTVRQRQQVRASDEVVSVEVAEADASGGADTHDCLKGRGTHQIVVQLVLVLGTVALGQEGGVIVRAAAGVLAEHREGCEVRVLAREQIGVHGDLHATELNSSRLVERIFRIQQRVLLIGA